MGICLFCTFILTFTIFSHSLGRQLDIVDWATNRSNIGATFRNGKLPCYIAVVGSIFRSSSISDETVNLGPVFMSYMFVGHSSPVFPRSFQVHIDYRKVLDVKFFERIPYNVTCTCG